MESLPNEVLAQILVQVSGADLIRSCILVCHKWRDVINSTHLWQIKCEKTRKFLPNITPPPHDGNYMKLYFFNPYGRNLLKNSCAKAGCIKWRIKEDGGNGFGVEDVPVDVKPLSDFVPMEEPGVKVWTTSYYWCVKSQEVDLKAEGVEEWVMDHVKPHIQVSDWYAARHDSGCAYEMTVRLLDWMGHQIDSHVFLKQFRQGEGGDWHQASHTFKDYLPGVRYVDFRHGGKDMEFLPGHYGVKFTLSSVRLKFTQSHTTSLPDNQRRSKLSEDQ
ncbi:F-box only protein 2-like [Haliotis cracherodii]|uniref:F-box only protein 2-like n=1 Tax=Haliotis cracherodii TaxID=6455 RepID=UPI0039ED5371